MSITTEIERLQAARNKLRTKGVELGITNGTAKLDEIAEAFDDIVDQGDISAEVKEGETFTIPAGYHSGSGTVAGVAGGGNYKLQSKTVTPTKKQQSITPDTGNYGLSDVIVQAIPDMYQDVTPVTAGAGDVLATKVIVNALGQTVAGTMPNIGAAKIDEIPAGGSATIPAGYHNGQGVVKAKDLASQTSATASAPEILSGETAWVAGEKLTGSMPNNGAQTGTVNAGASVTIKKGYHSGMGKITGASLASQTPGDAIAGWVLDGKTAWVNGEKVTGSMTNHGAFVFRFDGLTATTCAIPVGFHNGSGLIGLDSTIEDTLATI